MRGDMYQMDDELAALLTEAIETLAFWKGLLSMLRIRSICGADAFERVYLFHMIDYDGPISKKYSLSRTGKGDITPITNLEMAFKAAKSMEVAAPDLSRIAVSHLTENQRITRRC